MVRRHVADRLRADVSWRDPIMRVSKLFSLNLPQPSLDFVDVDTDGDTPVFVDPRALRLGTTDWGNECVSLIQDFFETVITAIREGRKDDAVLLLRQLKEPNETHLGVSQGKSRGRALGAGSAEEIYKALADSEAIKTGLIQDLEETALMVEGIGFDIVSDIATNIIREPLIAYTQEQAKLLGFESQLIDQDSGPMWDPAKKAWYSEPVKLPIASGGKLILVPKWIVRGTLHYNASNYFATGVLNFLVEDEIAQGTSLVRLLKDGTPRVDKKDLRKKYGEGKRVATQITLKNPGILDDYRVQRGGKTPDPLSHEELRERVGDEDEFDWDALVTPLASIAPGKDGATAFHKAAQAILTATLHPALTSPVREAPIHGGGKRIDILYLNTAQHGYFKWVSDHFPASKVAVECKNYSGDPKNPELDQLAGRFSPNRGKVGILVCRAFEDRQKFIERCKKTAQEDKGIILVIDDDDLKFLVECRKNDDVKAINDFFQAQHDELVA